VSLCKRRGFVFPGSEIYGGIANSWDYGPLGVELKNNLRDWWWKRFVQNREDMVGLDANIIMNSKVWEASGHLKNFTDPLVECKKCHTRFRADQLEKGQACENCGSKGFTEPKQFNTMFKTWIGATEEKPSIAYLRPEIAQAMFVNFKNVLNTTRIKIPFGIASVGKVFRNEITPGNFIFRTLEFDLMEFEYFIREKEWKKSFEYWLKEQEDWLFELGFGKKNLRQREHEPEERAHYSKRTVDIEYNTPFGWKELFGLAYRTDFDLKNHSKQTKVDLDYTDPDTGEKFIPHVIEPTFGLTRLMLMVLLEAYCEEKERIVLKLHPKLAPYKVAVFPLLRNKPELVKVAREIYDNLRGFSAGGGSAFGGMTSYDDRGNIGKRYYSQDEIGTPFCVTVDFDSLEDKKVTVRDRDTMKQERVEIEELAEYLSKKLE